VVKVQLVFLVALGVLGACDNSVVVEVGSGNLEFSVDSAEAGLPSQLEGPDAKIVSLPCQTSSSCPASNGFSFECTASACDPGPVVLEHEVGDGIDLDVLAGDAQPLLNRVDAVEIVQASYAYTQNSLTFALPPIELYWAPFTTSSVDLTAVRFGTVPGAGAGMSTSDGQIAIDQVGAQALSEYLVDTSRQVRFFARTSVDLNPGDSFPHGALAGRAFFKLRVRGAIVR
jgi:hypothetical protein